MGTQGHRTITASGGPVGDHRRLHDLLVELRRRGDGPSLRKINGGSGVSVGHLSEIFAGKTAPGPDVAVRIAQALKATEREQARVRFLAEGVEADRSAQRAGDTRREHQPGWEGCPYLGLPAYEERHALIFYGRRAMTGRLLDRLRAQLRGTGVLLVLGPSGAGKSSLLRAGLMGSLAQDALAPGCQFWPRRLITPTGDPLRQLAIHLADLAGTDAITVHEALVADPGRAHLLAGQALAGADPLARLVLVVDQLEELFTLTTDTAEHGRFLTALHSLATTAVLPDGRPGALVVAGIRGDFLDQALAFPAIRQAAEAGVFAVGAMSESELREAIAGPAVEAGVRIPDDLCTVVLDELRERCVPVGFDSGALPLLSQVMFVMWQARAAAGLTVEGYHRTGGVADIVRTSAERAYDSLEPGLRALTRRLFTHLTTVTDGRLTRRPSTRGALRAATGSADADLVIEAFAAQRLLTVADNDLVTIAHEELLRSWGRLRDWLQPSLTDQALHQALTDDVQNWGQRGHDPSYLYHGGRLLAVDDAVRRWAGDPGHHLTVAPATTEFLRAGHRRARRRRHAYQAVAAALVVLLVLTGATALLASRNAGRAERQHALALSRQLAALSRTTSSTDRITAEQLATAALEVAETQEALNAAGSLLAASRSTLPGAAWIVLFSPAGKMLATSDGADATVRLWDPSTGQPIRALPTGHAGSVWDAAFSPTGEILATSGGADGTVRLWDPWTGRPAGASLTGHTGQVKVRFSPDGGLLATFDDDTVRLWDPVTGKPAGAPVTGGAGRVWDLAFSPDGRRLAIAGEATARLWDTATRRPVGTPLTGEVMSVMFSPDGTRLVTGSADTTAQLRDPRTGRPLGAPLTGHTGQVAVDFSPDGKLLATSDNDAVRLWNPHTGEPVGAPLTGPTNWMWNLSFSPDGRLLATIGQDGTTRLWDPRTGRQAGAPLTGPSGQVYNRVAFSPDGTVLATSGSDKSVRLWNPTTRRPVGAPLAATSGMVVRMLYSPDGRVLAIVDIGADDDRPAVRMWDPATGLALGTTPSIVAAFSPDGKVLATSNADGAVRLRDPRTRRQLGAPLTGHPGPVWAAAFSPDGKLLATSGADATIRVWDTGTRRQLGAPLTGHANPAIHLMFSPDGRLLATEDGTTVRLWDTAGGRQIGEPLTGTTARLSPDGTLLAVAEPDGTIRLHDPATAEPLGAPLVGHTDPVITTEFSPDGTRLVAGAVDGTTRLWNTGTRRPVGDPATGTAAVFSPDGTLLAIAEPDGTIRLHDPATGRPLGTPLVGHTDPVTTMAFSPAGGQLVSSGGDGATRLWDTSLFRDPMAYLCGRAGGLSPDDWRVHAPGEPFIGACR
jgi:WD40 repeat protein/transcriptional regulator with XRE-family HTH domain